MLRASVAERSTWSFLFIAALALTAGADGTEPIRPMRVDEVAGPTLLIRSSLPGFYVPAPTVHTEVRIEVRGFVARGIVTQKFENPTDECIETLYVFPLLENAAVDQLIMIAGGRRVVGEVHEREEARRIHEEAKARGNRSSLLEQHRPNLFSVELSSLGPRESVEIEIGYQQMIDYRNGRFSMRIPLVVGPRYDPGGSDAGDGSPVGGLVYARGRDRGDVEIQVRLDSGVPLSEIASPTHAIDAVQTNATIWEVELDESVSADRDFVLHWIPRLGAEPVVARFVDELRRADGTTEFFTLLAVMPPRDDLIRRTMSRELVVIIDTSGSMSGEPLRQAKEAVSLALERLNPADRFRLIEFNSVTRSMTPRAVWADASSIEEGKKWISVLEAQGGTEMQPALELALDEQEVLAGMIRQVIFVTDGMVTNERDLARYVRRHIGESRLFTVGIGSAPNGHLMRTLARQGKGVVTHIDGSGRVRESMDELFSVIERPALTDLEIHHDDPSAEIYPGSISDLYAGEPVLMTIRHTRPDSRVRINGRLGSRRFDRDLRLEARAATTSGVEKLWARLKIEALEEKMLDDEESASLKRRIVEVALGHGLVSAYTSLVAVDQSTAGLPRCEPVPVPLEVPFGMEELLAPTLPGTATPFQWLLLVGLLLIASAATWDVLVAELMKRRAAMARQRENGEVER